jgi:hypothetical protein
MSIWSIADSTASAGHSLITLDSKTILASDSSRPRASRIEQQHCGVKRRDNCADYRLPCPVVIDAQLASADISYEHLYHQKWHAQQRDTSGVTEKQAK